MVVSEISPVEDDSIVFDNATSIQIYLTNLTPPRARAEAIQRGNLVDRRLTSPARLGVISGSAGSGKSTLLAQCHSAAECPAWLTLTPADNDPVHLWMSIVASIQKEIPDFGWAYADRLVAGQAAIDGIVTSAANELVERKSGLHLFLDDLHLLDDIDCRRSLHGFIDGLPTDVRVTAASRTTRPLPLARWRVEGELIEFTQGDLALSDEEAAAVLSEFGIEVESDVVSLLNERVEGWPAGITLACMALMDVADAGGFIRTFAGTDRSVAQFLIAEVVAQLTPANRDFLHKTAVLRQMSGELCDAM